MHNTVLDQYIWHNDIRLVDLDLSMADADSHIASLHRRNHLAIRQRRAVGNSAVDDMILENLGQLGDGEVWISFKCLSKSSVSRCEHGDVRERSDSRGEVSGLECADECEEMVEEGCFDNVSWDGEDFVDDVDYAAVKLDVLCVLSVPDPDEKRR